MGSRTAELEHERQLAIKIVKECWPDDYMIPAVKISKASTTREIEMVLQRLREKEFEAQEKALIEEESKNNGYLSPAEWKRRNQPSRTDWRAGGRTSHTRWDIKC